MKYLFLCVALFSCAREKEAPEVINAPKHQEKPSIECAGTRMLGWQSAAELTEQDLQNYKIAQGRCPELYQDMPCVAFFRKTGEGAYQALCGPQKGELPKPMVEDPI